MAESLERLDPKKVFELENVAQPYTTGAMRQAGRPTGESTIRTLPYSKTERYPTERPDLTSPKQIQTRQDEQERHRPAPVFMRQPRRPKLPPERPPTPVPVNSNRTSASMVAYQGRNRVGSSWRC